MPEPIRRTTARVVPVNRDGELLLLDGRDPQRPTPEFSWNGWEIVNDSHFFAVRVDDVTVVGL